MTDPDEALNKAVEEWQAGNPTPEFDAAVLDWSGSLTAYCRQRHPHLASQEDLREEASLWILEQMAQWRVGEGNVRGFISSRFRWFASAQTRGGGDLPGKSWFRLYSIAARVRGEAAAESRQLSMTELTARCRVALEESLVASITETNPDWADAQVVEEVARRMGKDGYDSALERLGEVLAAGAAPVRLDQPVGTEDDTATFGETLQAPGEIDEVTTDEEALDGLQAVMLGDAIWARRALAARSGSDVEGAVDSTTYADLAAETGHSSAELKAVLKLARARAHGPHAQWAHLADSVFIQVAEPTSLFADA